MCDKRLASVIPNPPRPDGGKPMGVEFMPTGRSWPADLVSKRAATVSALGQSFPAVSYHPQRSKPAHPPRGFRTKAARFGSGLLPQTKILTAFHEGGSGLAQQADLRAHRQKADTPFGVSRDPVARVIKKALLPKFPSEKNPGREGGKMTGPSMG